MNKIPCFSAGAWSATSGRRLPMRSRAKTLKRQAPLRIAMALTWLLSISAVASAQPAPAAGVPTQSAPLQGVSAQGTPGSGPPQGPNAASQDVSQAAALFGEGRALFEAKQYDAAAKKFEESFALEPKPGAQFNLAACDEARGRFGSASKHWRKALDVLQPGDPRIEEVRSNAAAAELRAGHLLVRIAPQSPAGMAVQWNGAPLLAAQTGVVLIVDSGAHTFLVSAPGYEPRTIKVSVPVSPENPTNPARPIEVELAPGPPKPVTPPKPVPATPPIVIHAPGSIVPPPSWLSAHKASLGIAVGGASVIGIGAIVAGTVTSVFSDIVNDCNTNKPGRCVQKDFDPAYERASIGNAIIVAGAAVVAVGVVVFLVPEKGLTSVSTTRARIGVGPTGANISLHY